MKDIFSSDKPVTTKENDSFQRYLFSKRIAETIIKRDGSEGLIIGLYGAWGEGKSTVLNFLENELNDEAIIVVRFNPWGFSYEENILTNFYHTLATSLEKKLTKLSEKIGKLFGDFGSLGSLAGIDLTEFGKTLSKVEPNILKERINEFIKESGKKVVVIIDDIDRLDKSEIFSLIKLVKVNADFFNTYYILSFDNDMVANAISERFGDGTKLSGEHFLEKIVQVPLRIPRAQSSDLRNFALSQIDDVLKSNNIELTQDEIQNFVHHFDSAILNQIETPRSALRYANSISFSFPLLLNEVNNVDLLLIEAIKIFYPDLYNFLQDKSNFLFDSYDNSYNRNFNREEIKKQFLDYISSRANVSKEEEPNVLQLLIFLFPRLNELLNNSFNMRFGETVLREKKIGSYAYFKRYFAYSVLKDEISDVEFDAFLKLFDSIDYKEIAKRLLNFKNNISIEILLSKLRQAESKLEKNEAIKLVKALSILAVDLKTENVYFLSRMLMNSEVQIAYMIKRILHNFKDSDTLNIYEDLISQTASYDFCFELFRVLHSKESEKAVIEEDDRMQLLTIIRRRMLEDSGNESLFVKFNNHLGTIFQQWKNENSDEYSTYIKDNVNDVDSLRLFVRSISPTISSSTKSEPYKSSIDRESYDWICKFVDVHYISSLIESYNSEIEEFENPFSDEFDIPTDDQRLRQFEYWFKK